MEGSDSGKDKKTTSAAEDVASGIVSFDPFKFLRTFRFLVANPDKIAVAVQTQSWEEILSPNKYFSACLFILVFGFGLFQAEFGLFNGETVWSYKHLYLFFAFVVLPFLIAHYLYLHYSSVPKNITIVDGLAKLFQCYKLSIGSALALVGIGMAFFAADSRAKNAGLVGPTAETNLISFFMICVVPLLAWVILVAPVWVLSKLYKLSLSEAFRAILFGVAIGLVGLGFLFGLGFPGPLSLPPSLRSTPLW